MFVLILIADPDSSKKSVFINYSSFSKIGSGTQSKMKDLQKRGKVQLCPFLLVFSIFDYVPIGIF